MRAFVIPRLGSSTVERADVPPPQIDDDELLVEVRAVGVGIHDSYFLPGDARYPYPIGIEAAGVVDRIGGRVVGYRPGERIAFVSSMQPKGGTWAEFVAVSAEALVIPLPDGVDFVTAAAVPVAGNTVLRAFDALSAVPPGGPSSSLAGRGRSEPSQSSSPVSATGGSARPRPRPTTTT